MNQRLAMLVDVQNLFYSAKLLHKSKVDYGKLRQMVVGDRQVVRSIAYVVQRPDYDNKSFCSALVKTGYEVRLKLMKVRSDNSARGNACVELTIDAMNLICQSDIIALVTGDGDFAPLAKEIRTCGRQVEVFSFDQSTARELLAEADRYVSISENVMFKEKRFESLPDRPVIEISKPKIINDGLVRTDGMVAPVCIDREIAHGQE